MSQKSRIARFTGEFIGVYCLVLAVGLNILTQSWIYAPFGIACAMISISGAMMAVSGSHLNPAVSLAVFAANRLPFSELLLNIVVQMSAGILGAISYTLLLSETFELRPPKTVSWKNAGIIEQVYCFMLCFVALNVTLLRRLPGQDQFAGVAIGFVFIAVGYSPGHIVRGGGWCNPAIAFGIDIANVGTKFEWCLIYLLFQGSAALIAAMVFRACRPDDHGQFWKEMPTYPLLSKCLAELTGTFLIVFTVGLGFVAYSEGACLANGAVIVSLTFALFSCSGAHFNPAVTIAVLFRYCGDFGICTALMYILSQLLGGVLAAYLLRHVDGGVAMTVPQPHLDFQLSRALWAEGIFTFVFCLVYLRVTREGSPITQFFGLAVGASYASASSSIRWVSGGLLNPAVVLAALSTHPHSSKEKFDPCPKVGVGGKQLGGGKCPTGIEFHEAARLCFAYVGAEIIGAVIAMIFAGLIDVNPCKFHDEEEDDYDEDERKSSLSMEDAAAAWGAPEGPPPESAEPPEVAPAAEAGAAPEAAAPPAAAGGGG